MNRRSAKLVFGLASLASMVLAGCSPPTSQGALEASTNRAATEPSELSANSFQYKYRLKAFFQVDGKEVTGESVLEVSLRDMRGKSGASGNAFDARSRGEAVVIDMGGTRGKLFVLLGGFSPHHDSNFRILDSVMHALAGAGSRDEFRKTFPDTNTRWGAMVAGGSSTDEEEFSTAQLPAMVHFSDLNDPHSMTLCDPQDLEACVGPGVRFKRLTVQVTDDAVSQGMQDVVPWLGELARKPAHSAKPVSERSLPEQLRKTHFVH